MTLITINKEKCIKCERCIKECPVSYLKIGKNGPEERVGATCTACGHCVAICPNSAIDNKSTPLAEQVEIKNKLKIDEQQAEQFLRSRRSIRNYKDKSVSKEKLTKLIDLARFAPTSRNSQGISFVVVQNRKLLERATEISIQMLEVSPLRYLIEEAITDYRKDGVDSVFRGAPNLIIAISDNNLLEARDNATSYLTYLELYAPWLGLGSCRVGIFEHCASIENSPLLDLFSIPKEKKIVAAVIVGYPKYEYKRLVNRNPLDAIFME